MAQQIKKKFIGNDQVDGTKVLLNNDEAIRSKDSLGVDQDILKLDASDKVVAKNGVDTEEIAFKSQVDAEVSARIAGDIALQGDLDIAEGQITVLQGEMDAVELAIADVNSAASALETRVVTADNEIQAIEDSVGVANGIATLDGSGKVPISQLPSAIMEYQGVYDASTNSPSLIDFVDGPAAGDAVGNVYRVTVAGDQDFGSGTISFEVGDYVILNSSGKWEKSDTTDAVASVNGYTSNVNLVAADIPVSSIVGIDGENVQTVLAELKSEIDAAVAGADTKQVKVSADDTTEGYLEEKIVGTLGDIVVTKIGTPGSEQLQISIGTNVATDADLAQEVSDRQAADNAIQLELDATQTGAGLDSNGAYSANLTSNYISTAVSLKNADELLDAQLKDVESDLADHIAQAVGAHAASAISNVPAGNLAATDVQGALNELQSDIDTRALSSDLTAHLNETVGAHAASAISVSPAIPDVAGDDVQTVLGNMKSYIDSADTALQNQINAITGAATPTWFKESFAIDLTIQNANPSTVTLTHIPIANSVVAFVDRLAIHEGVGADYIISGTTLEILNPGQGNNQIGNNDTIYVTYQYLA